MSEFKLLIAVDKTRFFYMRQFGEALSNYNVRYMLVDDLEIYDNSKFTDTYFRWIKTPKKLQNIIKNFNPDIIKKMENVLSSIYKNVDENQNSMSEEEQKIAAELKKLGYM